MPALRLAEWAVRRQLAKAGVDCISAARHGGAARPWDLRVHDPAFYGRLARNPAFQLGETYLDGLWDCDAIDELLYRLMISDVGGAHERGLVFHLRSAWARLANQQSRARAQDVTTAHYDLDAEIYRGMLDDSLTYTCAHFADPRAPGAPSREALAEAQRRKLAMICDKLELGPGDTLLDIGCGFGGLVAFAAEHYGVRALGVTNSRQHHAIANERYADRPGVELALLDYRELPALGRTFTKIASVEMIEAVGPKNFETFMRVAHGVLAPGGRFLVQAFISNDSRQVCNEWFDRYIFPNGVSPSFEQLGRATARTFGRPVRVAELGEHYAPTLLAWDANLRATWPRLPRRYPVRFQRMWHFYLRCLAGVFRAGDLRLCQIEYARAAASAARATVAA